MLDLFAGSGAVGLEALSRGAAAAVFVEADRRSLRALRSNLELAARGSARLIPEAAAEALAGLAREGATFDLLFADPPYDLEPEAALGDRVAAVAAPDASWAFEHRARSAAPEAGRRWSVVESRRYGDSALTLFRLAG